MSHPYRTVAALFVAGSLGALSVVGCSSTNTTTAGSTGSGSIPTGGTGTGVGSRDTSGSTGDTADGGGSAGGGDTGGNDGGGGGSNGGGAGSGGGGGGASGPTPAIASFTTPENIDCHNGNLKTFSASWSTTNAVKTTISIDGPGIYKTYGPNGEDSFPFNCSSSHTFLLTAFGSGGKTVTKSVTLQPRNVQKPQTPDSDDPPSSSTTKPPASSTTTKAPAPKVSDPPAGNKTP